MYCVSCAEKRAELSALFFPWLSNKIPKYSPSLPSWEKPAAAAVEKAAKTLRDMRIAEVVELAMQLDDGELQDYRAKVKVSFKYEGND